jgi:hypothetical protein
VEQGEKMVLNRTQKDVARHLNRRFGVDLDGEEKTWVAKITARTQRKVKYR